MSHLLRRSVVIGLGGTGLEAILQIKNKFWQVHGNNEVWGNNNIKLPEGLRGIRFLVLDTTEPKTMPTESGATIALEPGEFIRLRVTDPQILLRQSSEIRDWYPEQVPPTSIYAGAGQVRALGRLALFANSARVYSAIEQAFEEVRDWSVKDIEEFEYPSREVCIWVVGSLAGGTGSGTFLDVGFLTRGFMAANDTSIALLLLPDVFTPLPASDNVEPNAYGAIRELDFFMGAKPPFTKYYFNGHPIECRPPFDIIHLINNRNAVGDVYNDISHMTEVIGTGIYSSLGTAGQKASDIWDNLKRQILAQGLWDGRKPHYSSLGVSELLYDGERYGKLAACESALDIISQTFLAVAPDNVLSMVESFVDSSRIREDKADHVIDDLLDMANLTAFETSPQLRKQDITEAHQRYSTFIESARASLTKVIAGNLAAVKDSREKKLNDFLGGMIRVPAGIGQARQFLIHLKAIAEQYHSLLTQEAEQLRSHLSAQNTSLNKLMTDGQKLVDKILPVTKNAIEGHLKKFSLSVRQILHSHAQIERRMAGCEFFSVYRQWVEQWQQSMENFNSSIKIVNQRISENSARAKVARRRTQPFIREVAAPMPRIEELRVSPEAFLQWIEKGNPGGIVSLIDSPLEQIEASIMEFCFAQPSVSAIRNRNIESVLSELAEEERWEHIRKLYEMALPLWHYEGGYIHGRRKIVNILLFGVANSQNTILDVNILKNQLPPDATTYLPDIVDTGDGQRIICLNTQAALPAFAIDYIGERYRDPFFDENRPFTYHIHKNWDQEITDLIPPSETDEKRLYWSVGLAPCMNQIRQLATVYEVKSKKKGERVKDFWVRLDNGRAKAMRKFIEDSELVSEVAEEIETVLRKEGREKVLLALEEYRDRLKTEAEETKFGTAQMRSLINLELGDLDRYNLQLKEM